MKFLLAAIGLLIATTAQADSLPVNVIGYPEFCAINRSMCASGPAREIYYTPSLETLLASTQKRVNAAIEFRKDVGPSVWRLFPRVGDCEDYAASKLAVLLKAGLPREAMKLSVVQMRVGDNFLLHLVLIVRTTAGEFVLDNRYPDLKRPADLDYFWFAEERPHGGKLVFYSINAEWADFFRRKNWW